ncbi:unnamed protein product [Effrenium voratum]|uniref:WW domain-containing protein n=1 Tax=Effrenium voratum TaxID=2562239 RepID=A0AA36NHJ1_9DINO|nr:unnamed protein product [Effrenium voratum]
MPRLRSPKRGWSFSEDVSGNELEAERERDGSDGPADLLKGSLKKGQQDEEHAVRVVGAPVPVQRFISQMADEAKLPEPWVVTRDEQQRVCFHNKATRQTKWHHPLEPVFKELAAVCLEVLSMSAKDRYDHLHRLHTEGTRRAEEEMGQWNEVTVEEDSEKRMYYYNTGTKESSRYHPESTVLPAHSCRLAGLALLAREGYLEELQASESPSRSRGRGSPSGRQGKSGPAFRSRAAAAIERLIMDSEHEALEDVPQVSSRGPSGLAEASRDATLSRSPGLPIHRWMRPEQYARHLGLRFEDTSDSRILELLTPVFMQELPWPWVVETAGKQVYFCRRSSSLVTSWEHPMQSIHRRMMGVLQEARPSLQGPKLRMGLRKLMELELDGLVPSGLENLRACQGDDPRMEATSILALALIGCNKILRQLGEEAVDDATLWQQAAGAADRGQPSLQLGRMPMDRLEDASSCAKSTSPGNQSTWSGLARRHDDFINMATEADLAQCRLTGDVRNQGDQGSQRDLGGQEGQRQHREQSDPGVQRSHRDQGDQGSQRDSGGEEGQRQHREQSDPGVQRSHRDQGDQGSQRDPGGLEGQRQHREQSDPGVQRSHRDQGDQGSQRDRGGQGDQSQHREQSDPGVQRSHRDQGDQGSQRDRGGQGDQSQHREQSDPGVQSSYRDQGDQGSQRDRGGQGDQSQHREQSDPGVQRSHRDQGDQGSQRDRGGQGDQSQHREQSDPGVQRSHRDQEDQGSQRDRGGQGDQSQHREQSDPGVQISHREQGDQGSQRDRGGQGDQSQHREQCDPGVQRSHRDQGDQGSQRDRGGQGDQSQHREQSDPGVQRSHRDQEDQGGHPGLPTSGSHRGDQAGPGGQVDQTNHRNEDDRTPLDQALEEQGLNVDPKHQGCQPLLPGDLDGKPKATAATLSGVPAVSSLAHPSALHNPAVESKLQEICVLLRAMQTQQERKTQLATDPVVSQEVQTMLEGSSSPSRNPSCASADGRVQMVGEHKEQAQEACDGPRDGLEVRQETPGGDAPQASHADLRSAQSEDRAVTTVRNPKSQVLESCQAGTRIERFAQGALASLPGAQPAKPRIQARSAQGEWFSVSAPIRAPPVAPPVPPVAPPVPPVPSPAPALARLESSPTPDTEANSRWCVAGGAFGTSLGLPGALQEPGGPQQRPALAFRRLELTQPAQPREPISEPPPRDQPEPEVACMCTPPQRRREVPDLRGELGFRKIPEPEPASAPEKPQVDEELRSLKDTMRHQQKLIQEAFSPEILREKVKDALPEKFAKTEQAAVQTELAPSPEIFPEPGIVPDDPREGEGQRDIDAADVGEVGVDAPNTGEVPADTLRFDSQMLCEQVTESLRQHLQSSAQANDAAQAARDEEVRRALASELAKIKESEEEARAAAMTAELRVQKQMSETLNMLSQSEQMMAARAEEMSQTMEMLRERVDTAAKRANEEEVIAKRAHEESQIADRLRREDSAAAAREVQRRDLEAKRLEQELRQQREDLISAEREMRLQLELKAEQRELHWKAEHRELELKAEVKEMRLKADWQALQQLEDSELLRPTSDRTASDRVTSGRRPPSMTEDSSRSIPRSHSRVQEALSFAAAEERQPARGASHGLKSPSKGSFDARLAKQVATDLTQSGQDRPSMSRQRPSSARSQTSSHSLRSQQREAPQGAQPRRVPQRPRSAGALRPKLEVQGPVTYRNVAEHFSKWYSEYANFLVEMDRCSSQYDKGQGRLVRGYRG